jgi:hypothetical protein
MNNFFLVESNEEIVGVNKIIVCGNFYLGTIQGDMARDIQEAEICILHSS